MAARVEEENHHSAAVSCLAVEPVEVGLQLKCNRRTVSNETMSPDFPGAARLVGLQSLLQRGIQA